MTHLLKTPVNVKLDGAPFVGQRSTTWRFDIVDSVTGYRRVIKPVISGSAGIRHDTRSTIKRSISGLTLTKSDTAVFNSITSRLEPVMLVGGLEFPVGRYVPSDWVRFPATSGTTSNASFYDEGFIVDQQITNAFGANSPDGEVVSSMIRRFLASYPISFHIEGVIPEYTSLGSWGAGTRGGFILDQLALDGDYLAPWFDNTSTLRFIRSVEDELPSFDFDDGARVLRGQVAESDNLINAPNRFVVVGNGAASLGEPVVGVADVPSSAPHSIANRGFVVPEVVNRQVISSAQAGAIAANLARTQTLVEQVELLTLLDPRHDSYDVIMWQEKRWVEIAWTLPFAADGNMNHTLRRSYGD